MLKSGTIAVGTSATLIHTAVGRTRILIRNGNAAAVAVGDSSVTYPGHWMLSSSTPEATVLDIVLQDGDSIYAATSPAGTVINFLATN